MKAAGLYAGTREYIDIAAVSVDETNGAAADLAPGVRRSLFLGLDRWRGVQTDQMPLLSSRPKKFKQRYDRKEQPSMQSAKASNRERCGNLKTSPFHRFTIKSVCETFADRSKAISRHRYPSMVSQICLIRF